MKVLFGITIAALLTSSVYADELPLNSSDNGQWRVRFERQRQAVLRSHCGGYFYDTDVRPWLARCEQRIRKAGFDEKRFRSAHIQILIVIARSIGTNIPIDGFPHVIQSSGSKALDETALDLLRSASPFDIPDVGIPMNRPLILDLDYPKLELKYLPIIADLKYPKLKLQIFPKSEPSVPPWRRDIFTPPRSN